MIRKSGDQMACWWWLCWNLECIARGRCQVDALTRKGRMRQAAGSHGRRANATRDGLQHGARHEQSCQRAKYTPPPSHATPPRHDAI